MSRPKPQNPNPIYSAAARVSNAVRLHGEDSSQAREAQIESTTVRIEETIRKLVAQAPPLPEENRRRIKALIDSVTA